MDYFNNLLATFLSLDRVRILAVYGRVRELLECIKNIFVCVPKMNEGLTLGPGACFSKEVQPTLSLNLNSELTYSEMGNSEFSVSERLNCVSLLNSK